MSNKGWSSKIQHVAMFVCSYYIINNYAGQTPLKYLPLLFFSLQEMQSMSLEQI